MDGNVSRTLRLRLEKTAENLRKNGFDVRFLITLPMSCRQ